MNLILASKSPRRRELLEHFGLHFTVCAADIDECMDPSLSPVQAVADVSRRKALAVSAGSEDLILAADTIVTIDGQILGKPKDEAAARDMLCLLSGRVHQVITGVTLRSAETIFTETETTQVWFRELTDSEISAYIRSKEPMDKAGSYGIQGQAAAFIPRIQGDYFNVMGLPLYRLDQLLRNFDMTLLGG